MHYFYLLLFASNCSADWAAPDGAGKSFSVLENIFIRMSEMQTEFLARKSRGPLYSPAVDAERIFHCNLSRATSLSSA
jgi:hypothetical protein